MTAILMFARLHGTGDIFVAKSSGKAPTIEDRALI